MKKIVCAVLNGMGDFGKERHKLSTWIAQALQDSGAAFDMRWFKGGILDWPEVKLRQWVEARTTKDACLLLAGYSHGANDMIRRVIPPLARRHGGMLGFHKALFVSIDANWFGLPLNKNKLSLSLPHEVVCMNYRQRDVLGGIKVTSNPEAYAKNVWLEGETHATIYRNPEIQGYVRNTIEYFKE